MEFEPFPLIMGAIAGILGWVMANSMKAGLVLKIITTLVCLVAGYFLSSFIANK